MTTLTNRAGERPVMNLRLLGLLLIAEHCIVAWYECSSRTAGFLLLIFLVVVLILGSYEHLLGPAPNNVFRIGPGASATSFRLSVALLSGLEILGCWVAIRRLKT